MPSSEETFSWVEQAACRGADPDLMFPERGESTREAKELCKGCPVRADCLEYALDAGEKFGIWGGLSERERRRIRRDRNLAARIGAGLGVCPECGWSFVAPAQPTGRPRIYCSTACAKRVAERNRQRPARRVS